MPSLLDIPADQAAYVKATAAPEPPEHPGIYSLSCPVQKYAWGKPAAESEVAALHGSAGNAIDDSAHYAELWMGTHPNGPSHLAGSRQSLREFLASRPDVVGRHALARHGPDLPFLLKVLSVGQALSIQSHPDKALAARLHASRPDLYRDSNHKPEMTLALGPFEALCGFAPHATLVRTLAAWPELRELVGEGAALRLAVAGDGPERRAVLREAFAAAMAADAEAAGTAVDRALARVEAIPEARRDAQHRLVARLGAQYPRDVGVLAALFLNLLTLGPGEALPLGANEPHAYLHGDAVECMASSDNVIRAGLTPKPRDTDNLLASLTYRQGAPATIAARDAIIGPETSAAAAELLRRGAALRRYRPGFEEFEVWSLTATDAAAADVANAADAPSSPPGDRPPTPVAAAAADAPLVLPAARGPMIMTVLRGSGRVGGLGRAGKVSPEPIALSRGDVALVAAGSRLVVDLGPDARVYFAAAERLGFEDGSRIPEPVEEHVAEGIRTPAKERA